MKTKPIRYAMSRRCQENALHTEKCTSLTDRGKKREKKDESKFEWNRSTTLQNFVHSSIFHSKMVRCQTTSSTLLKAIFVHSNVKNTFWSGKSCTRRQVELMEWRTLICHRPMSRFGIGEYPAVLHRQRTLREAH